MKNPSRNDVKKGQKVEFLLEEGGRKGRGTVVGKDGDWFLIAFDKEHNFKPWVSCIIDRSYENFGVSNQYIGREARWAGTRDFYESEYITEILPDETKQVKDMTDILHREIIHGFDCVVYDNTTEDSFCIAVGPFHTYREVNCVGPDQKNKQMAHHPLPETPGALPWQQYYAQFAMCGRDLEVAKKRLHEMADRLKEEFGERDANDEPTWSAFDSENGDVLLVRNPSLDDAIETAQNKAFVYKDFAQDSTHQGQAWETLRDRWGEKEWKKNNVPSEFNLKKIAKSDKVQIVDHNGNDIKGEYLVNDKLVKAKEIVIGSAKDMTSAGALGLKLAGARRMNQTAYNHVIRPMMNKSGFGAMADDPKVKATMLMVLPLVLHPLAGAFEDKIPYAKQVRGGLELSFTETVRENSDQLMEFAEQLFKMMYIANNLDESSTSRIEVNYDKYADEGLQELLQQRKLRVPEDADRDDLLHILQEHDQEQALIEATAADQARVGA